MGSLGRVLTSLGLLPLCYGTACATWDLARRFPGGEDFGIALFGGAAAWLVLYVLLPKPWWLYVVGHELTHAIWALLFGGRILSMRAGAKGGSVEVSKTNFAIVLAPYFFPIYAVAWRALATCANFLHPSAIPAMWIHFGLGLAYAFHLTLTVSALRLGQPDIARDGWFFSGAIIFWGNACTLALLLSVFAGKPGEFVGWIGDVFDATGGLVDLGLHPARW
jgi:hypothetical protein